LDIALSFRWSSAAATHPGRVRRVNEDAVLDRADAGVWLVADGMGGHHRGDLASRTLVNMIDEMPVAEEPERLRDMVATALAAANDRLIALAQEQAPGQVIGTTAALLAVARDQALIAWVGDSRVYRLRDGRLEQMTEDHSRVQDLVRQGLLAPEDAENHPAANVVTRAVGAGAALQPDFRFVPLADNDAFLLCSDGLTKALARARIETVLKTGSSGDCAALLIAEAVEAGATDNVSVIVIRVEERTAGR